MITFVKLTAEEAIEKTLRDDPMAAYKILNSTHGDTIHVDYKQQYEVPATYAKQILKDFVARQSQ